MIAYRKEIGLAFNFSKSDKSIENVNKSEVVLLPAALQTSVYPSCISANSWIRHGTLLSLEAAFFTNCVGLFTKTNNCGIRTGTQYFNLGILI